LLKLKSLGRAESTINGISDNLTYLGKHVNLDDLVKISSIVGRATRKYQVIFRAMIETGVLRWLLRFFRVS